MATLQRAIAHAGSPCGSELIGDDLNFDVVRATHKFLEEDSGIAESLKGFSARTLKSLRELFGRLHFPDAPAPTAGGSFQHEWIADHSSVPQGVGQPLHWTAAPGNHRN